jgi:hypothetical protein
MSAAMKSMNQRGTRHRSFAFGDVGRAGAEAEFSMLFAPHP